MDLSEFSKSGENYLTTGDIIEICDAVVDKETRGLSGKEFKGWLDKKIVVPMAGGDGSGNHAKFSVSQAVAVTYGTQYLRLGGSLESVAKMVECISALSEDDLRDYSYFGKYCVLDLPGVDCNVIQITKQFLKSLNIPRFPKQLELGYVHSKVSVAIGKMLHRDIMESQERETRGRKRGSSQSSDS